MTHKPFMNIAFANDEYYFSGLWAAILSLLASTPDASKLKIHVIDTGISDASWWRLVAAVGKHPSPPELLRKSLKREKLADLGIPGSRSPLVYARLFLPELLDCDRVLYLDSDLLVFRNVLELEEIDLAAHACAAVINEDGGTLDFDLSTEDCEKLNFDPKSSYFNAGLIYMNLEYWRANRVTEKCLDFLRHQQFRLADQSALNAVMNQKIIPLDRQWNRLANRLGQNDFVSPECVIHYTTHKPWMLKSDYPGVSLWSKFVTDTGLRQGEPSGRPHVCERYLTLNFLRMAGYGCLALWCSIFRNEKRAVGYSFAFSYWVEYNANRIRRNQESKAANEKIRNTRYGPEWLVDVSTTTVKQVSK